jgi:hypothetical protein
MATKEQEIVDLLETAHTKLLDLMGGSEYDLDCDPGAECPLCLLKITIMNLEDVWL